jgi:hypothetical protein
MREIFLANRKGRQSFACRFSDWENATNYINDDTTSNINITAMCTYIRRGTQKGRTDSQLERLFWRLVLGRAVGNAKLLTSLGLRSRRHDNSPTSSRKGNF